MAAETDNQPEEAEDRKNVFELDGVEYEVPELRDLAIDEWIIVYKYSKVVLRDLMEIVDDPQAEAARVEKLEQPGVMKALFHVAYKRKHPKKTDAAVEALVGQIKYLPTLEAMNEEDEEESDAEVDPTKDSALNSESDSSEDERSSARSSDSSSGNGSSASTTNSETLEDQPATTGISG